MQVNGYTRELVLELIKSAHTYYETGVFSHQETVTRSVIGTLYQNALDDDILSVNAASARLGITAIDHSSLIRHSLRRDELLTQSKIIANAVDLLVTSIIDRETFGNGRDTTKYIASSVSSPVLGLSDDMFSSQAAISEILGLHQQLGGIEGRKIVLSWGFG
ncbi:MAG: hypothetical protein KAQ65_12580, partial [Candidatus Thorarchaeota archaeon]|nr:hypothetical protein [Candidatus Thorarchaeota archaeon]